jgi:hypothetical protein
MSDFRAAIHQYAAMDKRELPAIVTAKLGDLAFESSKVVKRTTKDAVMAFMTKNERIFWAFVNKVYGQGITVSRKRKAVGDERFIPYVDPSTRETKFTRKWISERKTLGGENARHNSRAWKERTRLAKLIMRRRAGRVKSFVGLFLKAAHLLGKRVTGSNLGKNSWKTQGVDAAKAVANESGKVRAFFTLPIRAFVRETKEGNRTARESQKVSMVETAIARAKSVVIADMMAKTRERYEREANRLNASRRVA